MGSGNRSRSISVIVLLPRSFDFATAATGRGAAGSGAFPGQTAPASRSSSGISIADRHRSLPSFVPATIRRRCTWTSAASRARWPTRSSAAACRASSVIGSSASRMNSPAVV